MDIDEGVLRRVVREEMKSVLKEIGLHDDDAGDDVRELRSLLVDWKGMKTTIWHTIARAGTLFVLGVLALGTWNKMNGDGSQ
jgi:hypothetical protein